MFRLLVSLFIAFAMFAPTLVHAETYTWTEDPPKEGWADYLECTAMAMADGNTVKITQNIGIDYGQPIGPERVQQRNECDRIAVMSVVNTFHYRYGTEITADSVSLSHRLH